MQRFYRYVDKSFEYCFYVETAGALTPEDLKVLKWLLAETFEPESFREKSFFSSSQQTVIEVGPV